MTNEEAIKSLDKLRSFHNVSYGESINYAIECVEMRKRNDQLFQSIKKLVVDQAIEYKKGYKQALEDYRKFSFDYSSCDHHCNDNSSCIDCFMQKVKDN